MRTVFKNKSFYNSFVIYIILLISWNLYTGIKTGNSYALLPISIQLILLILTVQHHKYARIAIIVWTAIFQIGGFSLIVLGNLLKIVVVDFKGFNAYTFIFDLLEITIGVIILSCIKKTVIIEKTNTQAIDSEITE